jgi:cellulose biosynthesis protein BcsQ
VNAETYDSYAFVILFRGEPATRVQQMLRAAVNPEARRAVYIQVPEVRGLEFFSATGPVGAGLDSWWQRNILPSSMPIFLALDEAGLREWIPGSAGCWFVGVGGPDDERALGGMAEPVFPVVASDPEVITEQAMLALGGRGEVNPVFHPSFPYRQAAMRWGRPVPRLDPPVPEPTVVDIARPAIPLRESAGAQYLVSAPPPPPQPISYDVQPAVAPVRPADGQAVSSPAATNGSGLQAAIARVQSGSQRLRTMLRSTPRISTEPSVRLGPTVNANRPIVAGFASRKGGVGKTTHAAGTAATIGEALDGLPDTAALVDGNITNPDSWALNPPPGSATVRTLVSCLARGDDPPPEQYARTPRLAIYPESRDSEEMYTQAEVDLVANYLRRRHSFIAIDLPNALPSLTSGGPGAVASAWLVHCDVVVLPFNADPRARQGLLEYVAVLADDPALARIPVVAPYIVSSNRAISTDPAVQADMAELRRRGVEVAEVPDDENALLALLKDLPINQASPGLRRAYAQLSEALVSAVLRARRQV